MLTELLRTSSHGLGFPFLQETFVDDAHSCHGEKWKMLGVVGEKPTSTELEQRQSRPS